MCFLFVPPSFTYCNFLNPLLCITYFCNFVLLHLVLLCTSFSSHSFNCLSFSCIFITSLALHPHFVHLHPVLSPCLFCFPFILHQSTLLFTNIPVKAIPSGRNSLEKLNIEYSALIIVLSERIQIRYFSHINFFTSIFAVLGLKAASPNYSNRFPFTH